MGMVGINPVGFGDLDTNIRGFDMTTLYEMIIEGKSNFLPFLEATIAYDNGWMDVDIGNEVIEDGVKREITKQEVKNICSAAAEYSASK